MKKLYFTMLGAAAILSASAQYSITSINIPTVGSTDSYYLMDTTNVLPGSAGTGQTWNFSTIAVIQPMGGVSYVTPSSTPNGASFPNATVASNDSSSYAYYKFASNIYQLEGFDMSIQGQSIQIALSDPGVLFSSLPVAYNYTNNTDAISGTVTSTVGNGTVTGSVLTVADGQGDLILPSGTITGTLRVKMVTTMNISLLFGAVTADLIETRYMWFGNGSNFPLFQTGTTAQQSSLAPSSTTRFARMNSIGYVGVNENANLSFFNLYPSPAKSELTVNFTVKAQSNVNIDVINQLGQVVRSEKMENVSGLVSKKIDLNGVAAGVYFVRFRENGFTKVEKFIVE